MKYSPLCTWAGLALCCFLAGCADFDRKFDEALYGSVEEADAVRAKYEAEAQAKFAKEVPKLEGNTFLLINLERKKYKSLPSQVDLKLVEIARVRARELADKYSKKRPNGQDFSTIFQEYGIDRSTNDWLKFRHSSPRYFELRACGPRQPADVLHYWLSRTEDRNILLKKEIKHYAVSVFLKNNKYYWAFVGYI